MSEPYFEELLQRCASLPYGPQLLEMLDRALEVAEQSGDLLAEYRVRLLLADACAMSGDSTGLLANFRWCLDRHDQDPERFASDPGDGADLLWQYKWMIAIFSADPQIPAAELNALLQEMHGHYRRAGLGGSAVLTARFEVAFANGWMDEAAQLHAELARREEDNYSYCQACVTSLNMSYLFATGHDAQGLDLLDALLAEDSGCGQEPAHAMSAALIHLLRAGRGAETKDLHVRSYQAARRDPDNLGLVANHLNYLAVTGNLDRALFLAERHLPWLAHDPMAQREHLAFLGSLGLLCSQLAAQGLGDLELPGSQAPELAEYLGAREHPARVEQVASLAWNAAYQLAARFDARNANHWTTQRVDAIAALGAERWELDWTRDPWLEEHQPVGVPRDAAAFLRRARERHACGHTALALEDVLGGLRAASSADVEAGLHQLAMILRLDAGDEEQAAGHLRGYAQSLERAGYRPLAELLQRHGVELHRDGTAGQLDALHRAHASASEDAFTRLYTGIWLAHAHLRQDQYEAARELCEQVQAWIPDLLARLAGDDIRDGLLHSYYSMRIILATDSGDEDALRSLVPVWRKYNPTDCSLAQVRFYLAQLAAEAGDVIAALEGAERALAVFIAYEDRARAIAAADVSSTELLKAGRVDRAKERLRLGLHHAELAESSQKPALLYRLAQLHVDSGEPHEAQDYLSRTRAEHRGQLGPDELAEILDLMGDAHGLAEQFQEAIDSWQQAADLFQSKGNGLRQLQAAEKLVNVFLLTGEFDEAQQLAERLVPLGRELTDTVGIQPVLNALMLLATVQEATGEGDTAGSFTSAAVLAEEHEQRQLQAQIMVKHAQWASSAGHDGQAVSLMLQAAALFEQLGQQSNAAQGIGAAATFLGRQARDEEAVLLFEQALSLPLDDPGAERTLRLRLADSLEALQRTEQAAAQRRRAEADSP